MSITGQRIKELRKAIGKSADQVADELGVSRSTIFRYESGYIEKVPANVISELADILGTTPEYLMGWTDVSVICEGEDIANENSICHPKGYDGDSERWRKYNMKVDDQSYPVYLEISPDAVKALKIIRIKEILSKLNGTNLEKVLNYSQNILSIQDAETEQQHLIPDAAHQRTDLSDNELRDRARNMHDDDIMDDPNF